MVFYRLSDGTESITTSLYGLPVLLFSIGYLAIGFKIFLLQRTVRNY